MGVWEKGSVGGGSVTRRRGERGGETGVGVPRGGAESAEERRVWEWGMGDDGGGRYSYSDPALSADDSGDANGER